MIIYCNYICAMLFCIANTLKISKLSSKHKLVSLKSSVSEVFPFIERSRGDLATKLIDVGQFPSPSLFLGTGLTSSKGITHGLPFDVVHYMLAANIIRKKFNLKSIHHVINDICPSIVGHQNVSVSEIGTIVKTQIQNAVHAWNLADNYNVYLASELSHHPEWISLREEAERKVLEFSDWDPSRSEYLVNQLAQMELMRVHFSCLVKLSWLIEGIKTRFDESTFDRAYVDYYSTENYHFFYTVAGTTFNSKRRQVSPYVFSDDDLDSRLLISEHSSMKFFNIVDEKLSRAKASESNSILAGKKRMGKIVQLFESEIGYATGDNLVDKVDFIKQSFLNNRSSEQNSPLSLGVSIIEPVDGLTNKLKLSRKLTIKLGFDPTSPDLHLGHGVVLKKMKEFQSLDHKIVIIIGDFTARIGDPTGRNIGRPKLSDEQIKHNSQTYLMQLGKYLDLKRIEIRYNSEWYKNILCDQIISMLAGVTLRQILIRDDFAKRFEQHLPIHMHELIYPLMQGYDSVQVQADIEMGGTDQLFNNLMGRQLQQQYDQEPQVVLCMPLLRGIDGEDKMSKSKQNYVGVSEPSEVMFAKIMSIPDNLLTEYLHLTTDFSVDRRNEFELDFLKGSISSMNMKLEIARNIVQQYHGENESCAAEQHFNVNVRKIGAFDERAHVTMKLSDIEPNFKSQPVQLLSVLKKLRPDVSNNELRRLIAGGSLKVNQRRIIDFNSTLEITGDHVWVQLGKRQLVKVKCV